MIDGSYQEAKTYSKWGSEYEQGELVSLVEQADFFVAHNAIFELQWLQRCGLNLYSVLPFCTQVAEYVRLSNRQGALDLDTVLKRWGLEGKENLIKILMKGKICPSEMPKSLLEKYCKQDVKQTFLLFLKMRSSITTALMAPISTRIFTLPMLAHLESVGLAMRGEIVEKLYGQNLKEGSRIGKKFKDLTNGINFDSSKQVATFLYDTLKFTEPVNHRGEIIRTEKGNRKTDIKTIEILKATTPEQKEFKLLAKELSKTISTLEILSKLVECNKNNNGILYFNYKPTVVKTGRLSSSGGEYKIQGQNIARSLKYLFGPRNKGWNVGEIDYPNLEWRVAGHYGRDKQLLDDVLSGFNVHNFSASVFIISRQDAKAETFRPLFGSKGQTPKQKKYAIEFRKRWSGVDSVQQSWAMECVRTKKVVTETGWIFYWPAEITRSGYITYTTQIYDYPIQYLAGGEITLMACLHMWYLGRSMDSFMINTVHDSNIWEVAPWEVEDWKELGIDCFTKHVYNYLYNMYGIDFYIPLGAGIKVGEAWSIGEETKVDVTKEGEKIYRTK